MICGKCGANNPNDARHCAYCGNALYKKNNAKKRQAEYIIVILIIAIIILAVVITGVYIYKRNNANNFAFGGSGGGSLPAPAFSTNPPLSSTVEPVKNDLIDMNKINEIILQDENSSNISVCVIDLKNETEYSTSNSDIPMSASALVNIPILYTVSKELESGNSKWNTPINFTYRFSGRGSIKKSQDNTNIPLSSLLVEMLNYSDNNATNSLIDYYGRNYIASVCESESYSSVDIQRYIGETNTTKDNYISANDIAKMLSELYTSDAQNGINADYLKSNFKILDNAQDTGIGKYIPAHVTFLNHNAVTSSVYNEVAVVSSDNATYVIAFLSNNGKMDTSANTAGKISNYVYTALNQ